MSRRTILGWLVPALLLALNGVLALSSIATKAPAFAQQQASMQQADKGTVVASIAYQVIDRPAEVPASFAAPDGVQVQFLSYTAIDGVSDLAALVQPQGKAPRDTTLILYVHGSGGNFYGPVAGNEVMPLAQKGTPA
jgi:hypothetical protein